MLTLIAVKILEKSHIIKEKKTKYVMTEKEVCPLAFCLNTIDGA